ncbi:hypothetical protein AB1A64_12670 [Ruegeria sp. ANG10]|uniref:hypothetical protein n=1 Tax=Ruegeria sp. ANG10 TaxID=3042467 RepID=UPI00345317BF
MKFSSIAVALACAVALSGCGAPSTDRFAAKSFAFAETNQPVQVFSEACLKTLPNFDTFSSAVQKQGLAPTSPMAGNPAFMAPGEKFLATSVIEEGDKSTCAVVFLGAENSKEIGDLFLQEASIRTGGEPQDRLPRGQYNYVYHLKNGSVLVYEAKNKRDHVRHFVFVTKPVSRKEAASYVYN